MTDAERDLLLAASLLAWCPRNHGVREVCIDDGYTYVPDPDCAATGGRAIEQLGPAFRQLRRNHTGSWSALVGVDGDAPLWWSGRTVVLACCAAAVALGRWPRDAR